MKKALSVLLALLMVTLFAACGGGNSAQSTGAPSSERKGSKDHGSSTDWKVQQRYPIYNSGSPEESGFFITNSGELVWYEKSYSDETVQRTTIATNTKAVYSHAYLDNADNLYYYTLSITGKILDTPRQIASNVADFNGNLVLCNDGKVLYYDGRSDPAYQILQDGARIFAGKNAMGTSHAIISKTGDYYEVRYDSYDDRMKATKQEERSGIVAALEGPFSDTPNPVFLCYNSAVKTYSYGNLITYGRDKIASETIINYFNWNIFPEYSGMFIGGVDGDGNYFTKDSPSTPFARNVKVKGNGILGDWYLTNDGKLYSGGELRMESVVEVYDEGNNRGALMLRTDGTLVDRKGLVYGTNVKLPS